MAVKVYLPTPLRQYAEGREVVELEGSTVGEVLMKLVNRFTALQKHLFTETGGVRSFVNVFLNDEDIRYLKGLDTEIKDGGRCLHHTLDSGRAEHGRNSKRFAQAR
jgi:molybdopterin converting factor small subunit